MRARGRSPFRMSLSLLVLVAIAAIGQWTLGPAATATGLLRIAFIDVGQGDSAWLNTPDGWDILIDGGESSQGQELVSYLQGHGVVDIEVMVLTHPHADHVGGLVAVIQNLEVDQILSNCQPHTSVIYQTFQDLITDEEIPVVCVRDGDVFAWGSYVSAAAVHPPEPLMPGTGSEDINNNSIVLRITHGSIDLLFTGDIEADGEAEILSGGATLEAEVLKVAHHGSDTSSGEAFLSAVSPGEAVISVGENSYGHPGAEALQRLAASGATLYRTDVLGTIVMESDGATYWVQPEWRPRMYCPLAMTPLPDGVRVNAECSEFDAPGTEEYVCFTNWGASRQNMKDWKVRDEVDHTYTFPVFNLWPGATVRLHTGSGTDSATDLYWGRGSAVWNNDGDTVYLYDDAWNLVDSYTY